MELDTFTLTMGAVYHFCKVLEGFTKLTTSLSITYIIIHFLPLPPKQVVQKIIPAVMALANNPRPSGCKKLKGSKYNYRIRIGDYRVIYEIEDAILRVSVLAASHRKDVYE